MPQPRPLRRPVGPAGGGPLIALAAAFALVVTSCSASVSPSSAPPSRAAASGSPSSEPTGRRLNCLPTPHKCGYPDETNTGVPVGTTLLRVPEDAVSGPGWTWRPDVRALVVDGPGTVISGLRITDGMVIVYDPGVTIRDVYLSTREPLPVNCSWGGDTRKADSCLGLVVEDTEIIGLSGDCQVGLAYRGYTARRVHVSRCQDGFKADADVVIEDSYVEHLWFEADGAQTTHNDAVQTTGGSNVTLRHNTFRIGDQPRANAVVQFGVEDAPTISGWVIDNNLIDGGGLAFNARPPVSDTIVENNRFTDRVGQIGALPEATWKGNYRDSDGRPVP